MNTPTPTGTDAAARALGELDHAQHLAGTLLSIAAEVESAEADIKRRIIAAAEAGDTKLVIALTKAWIDLPPIEALKLADKPPTARISA